MCEEPNAFSVAQLGARRHYAVPRILYRANMLERLFTDICAVCGWPRVARFVPGFFRATGLRRLLARVPEGIPPERITAFNSFGREYACRRSRARTAAEETRAHLWAGKRFCELILTAGFGEATGVYGFNSAALEILREARARGLRGVVEQTIAPKRVEIQLLEAERAAFPDWEPYNGRDAAALEYMEREEAEWQAADLIVCGSDFVKQGIGLCGGPVEKCVVVPYGVDVPMRKAECGMQRGDSGRPLRVLTVGAVGLRKGSPYVLEAAKCLGNRAQFRMVGSIGVTRAAEHRLREHVEVIGPVPRSEVTAHFQWADVFLLPSICEGSAIATYEALAYGLPVICTPNTGSVICDGREGFVVPARDASAIVHRLEVLAGDVDLRLEMSTNAAALARRYTIAAYGQRLLQALGFMSE